MIPKLLRLKNFLSYGNKEETVDFGSYPLICLNGKNGHGKSALLDAMTWALWGQARKTSGTSKPDAQLLHLGQTFMTVSFDFIFNNQMYRVRREHAKTHGDPHAALDFGIINEATGGVISLTDKTIKKTQEKIITTIGLDYDAFINTAFLRQGQANEFSKKSPKDRKDLLANILSLGQFDNIRKRASEKHKELLATCTHMIQWNERIEKELAATSDINQQLLNFQERARIRTASEQQLLATIKTVDTQLQADRAKQAELEKSRIVHQERLLAQSEVESKLQATLATWKSRHKLFLSLPDTSTIQQRKQSLIEAINQHQARLQHNLNAKELQLKIKHEQQLIATRLEDAVRKELQGYSVVVQQTTLQISSVEQQHKQITQRIQSYHDDLQQFAQETATIQQQELQLKKQIDANSGLLEQFEKRKTTYHTWAARLKMLEHEQQDLSHKQRLVSPEENPSCPLCEQNLSAARKRFLKTKFSKVDQFLLHRKLRLSNALKKLKPMLIEQHAQLEHSRALINKVEQLVAQQASHTKMSEKTKELQKQQELLLKELELKQKELQKQLASDHAAYQACSAKLATATKDDIEYQQYQHQLNELEVQVTHNKYDQQAHQAVHKELEQVQHQEAFLLQAQEHTLDQTQRRHEIHELIGKLKNLKKDKLALAALTLEQETLERTCQQLSHELSLIQHSYDELMKEKEAHAQEQGKLQQQQIKLTELAKEHQEYLQKIELLKTEADEYYTIATAMGKDGIQALLIEDALPEIEHEANSLLGQLTDNQAHIIIESLRDLKKGGTKETLDIKISDPAGIRPYEMFSGGEAFRIDFALRIAISKLLARRAGTSLQTLIIDEGFGSQDEEGLANITQALHKIQDHFKKIIIVSHLTAMKDQFPVHFYVEKRGNASHVQVIEQD